MSANYSTAKIVKDRAREMNRSSKHQPQLHVSLLAYCVQHAIQGIPMRYRMNEDGTATMLPPLR